MGLLTILIGGVVLYLFLQFGLPFLEILGEILPKSKKEKAREAHIQQLENIKKSEAELKGASFENQIRDLILYYFPGATVKQNIIVRNGKYSKEIDLIALTPKGFILVEAKNYNHCRIVGEVKEKNWKVVYNEQKQFHLYNPLFQLNSGVWNIKKHLPNIYLDRAVVFSDDCELSKDILNDDNIHTLSSFKYRLMMLSENEDSKYSETYIEQISSKLDQIDTVSREEHIKNVEEIREANA